jgi:hypothetical protein
VLLDLDLGLLLTSSITRARATSRSSRGEDEAQPLDDVEPLEHLVLVEMRKFMFVAARSAKRPGSRRSSSGSRHLVGDAVD